MSEKIGKLQVVLWGCKHYIEVPSIRATALHTYLRSRNIVSWPPQTHTNDTDSIELGSGVNVKAVQALLDQWS
jgi:hypothetical protein